MQPTAKPGAPALTRRAAAMAMAGAFFVAGGRTAGAAGTATLRIANFQNANVLPLFYGIDKGYFAAAGLDVQIVKVPDGAASVAAVASGQADIGWSATAVPMFARANGVPVKVRQTITAPSSMRPASPASQAFPRSRARRSSSTPSAPRPNWRSASACSGPASAGTT